MAGRLATGTLADRGASNPDAFASYLASRVRDGARTIGLAGGASLENQGSAKTCPNCGYDLSDDGDDDSSETLRTPAPSTGYVRDGAPLTVRSSNVGLANQLDLTAPRYPVTSPMDLLVTNSPNGGAMIRHRRGGAVIGEVHENQGWRAVYGGKEHTPRTHQRAALADLLGLWNAGTTTLQHEGEPLQPPPAQTPLMEKYGIPAIRALATPSAGVSDGPRTTTSSAGSDNSDDNDSSGMSPRASAVYKKLIAKGWPAAKAKRFAANADRFGSKS